MVKLDVEGDWSPRPQSVDVLERSPAVPWDLLRSAIEQQMLEVKVNHFWGGWHELKACLQGRWSKAPILVLNCQGARMGKGKKGWGFFLGAPHRYAKKHLSIVRTGVLAPRELARLAKLNGRVVVGLGAGLGRPEIAKAFIKAGASAVIGSTGSSPTRASSRLLFADRLFDEILSSAATLDEGWRQARIFDRETARFRLWIARRKGRGGTPVAVRVPNPPVPAYVHKAYSRTRGRRDAADWRLPVPEVDILTIPSFPAGGMGSIRSTLELMGMRVNLFPCRSAQELKERLGGKGITAPLVILESHGSEDKEGKPAIVAEANRSRSRLTKLGPKAVARCAHLAGRVVIASGCNLGAPEMAAAFLKGKPRAFIGATPAIGTGGSFLINICHELVVNRMTVRQAWKRASVATADSRRVKLYPAGCKPVEESPKDPVVTAPALIEGFEGDLGNDFESQWDSLFYDILLGSSMPAPGGRPGMAFKMPFAFARQKWPGVSVFLPAPGQRWINAKGVSFDAYVPFGLRLSRRLVCLFSIKGEGKEYARDYLTLERGWNHIRLPFDSPLWRGKDGENGRWRTEPFNLDRVQPVKRLWIALRGQGRREEGAVYFDNLRLEKKGYGSARDKGQL